MSTTLTHIVGRLLAKANRYGPAQAWLRQLAAAYTQSQIENAPPPGFEVPEISPLLARASLPAEGSRLNLLLPAISSQHVFGGIQTALQVFDAIRPYFSSARIILTDEAKPQPSGSAFYSGWPLLGLSDECPSQNHIVAAGDRWGKTLPVHAQDHFVATAWWTAHNAYALLKWQQAEFPALAPRRLLYLIQDFEPGFYPWSSRFVLAKATYAHPKRTVAVINSSLLADYLRDQGCRFPLQHVLAPQLHPALAAARKDLTSFVKERLLLVYGRPGTERNAFSVLVAALRLWAQRYPGARQWKILSAGEAFPAMDLGHHCQLQSLGKLPIRDYADVLSRAAVGMSLMISPHPSYPPLEMAAFGARVITNRFANKDLSKVSSFMVSVDEVEPNSLADALVVLTTSFDGMDPRDQAVDPRKIDWHDDFLQPPENIWDWTSKVASELLTAQTD